MNVLELYEEPSCRDLIVGDLHGCHDALIDALHVLNFNILTDRLLSVGDLVDRGPKSFDSIRLLEEPWFYAVKGNHEDNIVVWDAGEAWYKELDDTDKSLVKELISDMPDAITLQQNNGKKIVIIHAAMPPIYYSVENLSEDVFYDHEPIHRFRDGTFIFTDRLSLYDPSEITAFSLIVHGHNPIQTPIRIANRLYIDTGLVYKYTSRLPGKLTLFEPKKNVCYAVDYDFVESKIISIEEIGVEPW